MSDSEEIKARLEEYYSAFNSKEWDKFSSMLTDGFSYFSDNMTVMDKACFIEFLMKDKWQGNGFEINSLEVRISENNDLGFAMYNIIFKGLMQGKEAQVHAVETTIFVKENNEWKVIHSHVSNK